MTGSMSSGRRHTLKLLSTAILTCTQIVKALAQPAKPSLALPSLRDPIARVPLGATEERVRRLLGNPDVSGPDKWIYYLSASSGYVVRFKKKRVTYVNLWLR